MKELFDILSPYDNWQNDTGEEENLKARQALFIFYEIIKKLKPEQKYRRDFLHISYVHYLVKIRKSLMGQKYMRVCNELISLIYYEPILQKRIYYNIIKILEEGLNIRSINIVQEFKKATKSSYTPGLEFKFAMDFAQETLAIEKSNEDQIVVLDFMLNVIRNDLSSDILYLEEDITAYPFPLFYYDEQGNKYKLPGNGFVHDKSNHWAYCFPYISLCYVHNGKYLIPSGITYKKGIIQAKEYDITKLFPHMHTDGINWYNSHSNEKRGELADFRLGVIYEIARLKYTIE